jgi:hypothetical protein
MAGRGNGLRGHHVAWDQGGGQSGEEDAQAAFEFGGAVVGGQAVKAEPQHVAGFAGILDEFLELVVHVAVQNPNCCMARWLSRWLAC